MSRPAGRVRAVALAVLVAAPGLAGQAGPDLRGYALGLAAHVDDGPSGPGGAHLFGRLRLMPSVPAGPVTFDAAWEQLLVRVPEGFASAGLVPGASPTRSTDWLDLDGVVRRGERTTWTHRLDRLSVAWDAGRISLTVGRQAISWATTLFLTPADPFAPFDPSDPFREYRGGVDAVRVRAFPGPFSEVELVLRGAGTVDGDRLTAVARAQTSRGGWAFGGWGGWVHEEGAAAVFVSGALGSSAVRAEATVRETPDDGGATFRSAVGLDRNAVLSGRDVYAIVELQYDGFGADRASDLLEVIVSKPYSRGELQTLSTWMGMARISVQAHPLVSLDGLVLTSLSDRSALVAPGVAWSATGSATVRVGAYLGVGPDRVDASGPASGYGPLPRVLYASLAWFF